MIELIKQVELQIEKARETFVPLYKAIGKTLLKMESRRDLMGTGDIYVWDDGCWSYLDYEHTPPASMSDPSGLRYKEPREFNILLRENYIPKLRMDLFFALCRADIMDFDVFRAISARRLELARAEGITKDQDSIKSIARRRGIDFVTNQLDEQTTHE